MKLPFSFKAVIKKHNIEEKDIIFAACADFDEDYRFAETIVALTKEKMIVARYAHIDRKEFKLGGYSAWQFGDEIIKQKEIEEALEPAYLEYKLEDVEKLQVIREISNGVLLAKINGLDRKMCLFSNTRMGAFMQLSKLIDKIKKNDEIKEADLDVKRGKECCPKCGMIYPDQERKICPKCMNRKSVLGRILSYFLPYKWHLVVMILCYFASAGVNLIWPYISGTVLYDDVLGKNEEILKTLNLPAGRFALALLVLVIAMIVTRMVLQGIRIIQGVLTAKIAPEVVAKLKSQTFDAMSKLSISFFTKRQTGGLMTRVCDDAEEISSFFIDGVPYFFINILTTIATCIVMFAINPLLAVCSLLLLPVLFIISYKMMPHLWHFYGKRHRAKRRLNAQMNENLTGARVVKAFGQERQEMARFKKSNKRVRESELDLTRYDNRFNAIYTFTEDFSDFLVWAVGGAIIIAAGNLELGMLITFAGYVGQLRGPLEFMSRMLRWYTSCMNSGQRIFEIMDAIPEVREALEPVRPESFKGEIELKNVTFGYEPNKPVLKDVSFHIMPGEVFGIVGRSGAGKSTLVNLISRLYDAEEGEVLVDGINVKQLGFKELRKNVAMVSQETYIFMGTVAENIAYARPDATREEIVNAAIQANAHDFICKMPEGYDTIIGASSRSLSGGEKQRISIARAILADPKILILDEATSAVDTETELSIQKALEELEKGRTVLSIAHRLSTLRNASHLIVIDEGKVTESGTHEELIAMKGTFYKLMQLQTKALAMRGLD